MSAATAENEIKEAAQLEELRDQFPLRPSAPAPVSLDPPADHQALLNQQFEARRAREMEQEELAHQDMQENMMQRRIDVAHQRAMTKMMVQTACVKYAYLFDRMEQEFKRLLAEEDKVVDDKGRLYHGCDRTEVHPEDHKWKKQMKQWDKVREDILAHMHGLCQEEFEISPSFTEVNSSFSIIYDTLAQTVAAMKSNGRSAGEQPH